MDNGKLEKANQLNRRIGMLKDNIAILASAKRSLETDLQKLQAEFDAL